jgi:4-azaleucine resistance transporter AzlC
VSIKKDPVALGSWTSQASEMRRGAIAMTPLLAGVPPFGMAFAVSAQAAGFSPLETMLISMTVFAGGAQMAAVSVTAAGGGPIATVLTGFALNLRYALYGLSLSTWLPRHTRPAKPVLAATMTDEGFAMTTREAREGRGSAGFLWGANALLYVSFALANLAGLALGQLLPDPTAIGLDIIFPLSFIALLLPIMRSRQDIIVALVGGIGAFLLRDLLGAGPAILVAVTAAALLGAGLDRVTGVA